MALSKVKIFLIVFITLLTSTVVSFFVAIMVSAQQDQIYPGVQAGNISLGGLTRDEARKVLKEFNKEVLEKEIKLVSPAGEGTFRLADIGTSLKVDDVIKEAWKYGREGNLMAQWRARRRIAREGAIIPLGLKYSREKFLAIVNQQGKAATIEPRNARFNITAGDKVEIIPGKDGKMIDTEDALKQMEEIIAAIPAGNEEKVINLALKIKPPARKTEDLEKLSVNGILAHYSTFFNINKTNRVYNIKVAARALDGHLVEPGAVFSFNKIVGPRSEEAGYKMAPTILNNEFVDSLGGGVCQASTTLYNALLLAGLEITERSSHSLVVNYVPLGQDAAVAYGYKDLKFKNNLSSGVVLKTEVVGNRLTVKIFGDKKLKKEIRISNKVQKTYPFKTTYKNDSTIPKGQKIVKQNGVNGYRVTSKRSFYSNGSLVANENLPTSTYKPQDKIVLVGTKNVPVAKKPKSSKPTAPGNTGNGGGAAPGNGAVPDGGAVPGGGTEAGTMQR